MGEHNPVALQRSVYFGLGMQCCLRSVQDHHSLRRWTPKRQSQITFFLDENRNRCIEYKEDHVTKTHDGGITDLNHDRKERIVHSLKENKDRCLVYMIDKYLGLCPPHVRKG